MINRFGILNTVYSLLIVNVKDETCATLGCMRASTKIMGTMDPTVNPCDNFYNFACGGYLNSTFIEYDKSLVSGFSKISDQIQTQLQVILNEDAHVNQSKPFSLAKKLYKSCMNLTKLEEIGLKPAHELLEQFGGWPVAKGDQWSEEKWDLIKMLKKKTDFGLPTTSIISTSIGAHFKNSSKRVLRVKIWLFQLTR